MRTNYTEEEVIALIYKAFYDVGYYIDVTAYPDGTTDNVEGLEDWFNKNKKKNEHN